MFVYEVSLPLVGCLVFVQGWEASAPFVYGTRPICKEK
jgi:hypothetical protein